jgi:PAS domain-containing protein
MSPKPIEALLTIEWSSHLSMPVFVIEPDGTLLFYNEPAETLLGSRFEETGPMSQAEWAAAWGPTDSSGNALDPEQLPLLQALARGEPAHGSLSIAGMDGVRRHLDITAIPLAGAGEPPLGAVAIFWESSPE